ncbi:MAG: hypothetical protein U7123_07235 [Potamolinea sp.]
MQKTSAFFKAVADVLKVIENLGTPSDQYGVVDAGETLELSSALYKQIKNSSEYRNFESNGGGSYCYDDE